MKKIILSAAFLVMTVTPSFADWAAIALSMNTGTWGKAWNYGTQTAAETASLEECRKHLGGYSDDCKVVTWASGGSCVAVAVAHESDGSVSWGTDSGNTVGVARSKAMDICYTYAKRTCDEVLADVCSNP